MLTFRGVLVGTKLFSKWTDEELQQRPRCHCPCHTEPGVYPTTAERPCSVCGHVNAEGYMPGSIRDGWVKYLLIGDHRTI